MTVRIEAGCITFDGIFFTRQVHISVDGNRLFDRKVRAHQKSDLEIIDHENFMKE